MSFQIRNLRALAAAAIVGAVVAGTALASAPPVGPLPAGPVTTISAARGTLVAVALPHQKGLSWRLARPVDPKVLREVSEADVGASVVVVFKALAPGRATVVYAATRGESTKAVHAATTRVCIR